MRTHAEPTDRAKLPTRRERETFTNAVAAALAHAPEDAIVRTQSWRTSETLKVRLGTDAPIATLAQEATQMTGETPTLDTREAHERLREAARALGIEGDIDEDAVRALLADAARSRDTGPQRADPKISNVLTLENTHGERCVSIKRWELIHRYQSELSIGRAEKDAEHVMADALEHARTHPRAPRRIIWAITETETTLERALVEHLDPDAIRITAPWIARKNAEREQERAQREALEQRRQAVLDALTDEQRSAVEAPSDANILVEAGAGTGKTRSLEARVVRLLEDGIAPERIIVVTFTNRAARELEARIKPLIDASRRRKPTIGTFHGIAAGLLRRRVDAACALLEIEPPLTPDFSILDTSEQGQVLSEGAAEVADEAGWRIEAKERDTRLEEWQRFLRINPDPKALEEQLEIAAHTTEIVKGTGRSKMADTIATAQLARAYRLRKARRNCVDFTDLISIVVRMLDMEPELVTRYDAVLVDEYQDTDESQERMLQQLRQAPGAPQAASLFAVGDPDQLIYGWRGAAIKNIMEMPERTGATRYLLTLNWRSPQGILNTANAALTQNARRKRKILKAAGQGTRNAVLTPADEWSSAAEEGKAAAIWTQALMREGAQLGEIAMLARTRDVLTLAESALAQAHIPYRLTTGRQFAAHTEIRDVAAWLRLIVNAADDPACDRILRTRKGLGDRSAERARERAQGEGRALIEAVPELVAGRVLKGTAGEGAMHVYRCWRSLCDRATRGVSTAGLVADVIEETGIGASARDGLDDIDPDKAEAARARLRRLDDLRMLAAEHASITSLAEHLVLADTRCDSADGRSVTLSTIHQAKGLEWSHVLLIGFEDGVLPHHRCAGTPDELAEERRCLHVALTRARASCRISWCRYRHGKPAARSPFVTEIGATLHIRDHD